LLGGYLQEKRRENRMTESVDQEVQAIKVVLSALGPLSEKARVSVLEYVVKRLDLTDLQRLSGLSSETSGGVATTPATTDQGQAGTPLHIKTFKEQKKPRSANEMAAVVAYYLGNVTAAGQRKGTVNQKDIETYFKIAGFPLPQQVRVTLPNARAAGYFDAAGGGQYRLNAVGHNLVAHTMPRGGTSVLNRGTPGREMRKRKAPRLAKRRSS
jgi:hypothetical protein